MSYTTLYIKPFMAIYVLILICTFSTDVSDDLRAIWTVLIPAEWRLVHVGGMLQVEQRTER